MTMGSAGEFICSRPLDKAEHGYVPGQHEARIIDPRPHRDKADMAAILTYVDSEGRACAVTCLRYRDERGWRSITLLRADLRRTERSTAVGSPKLEGDLLAVIESAAEDVAPWPFEPPSEEEQAMRRLARKLIDRVAKADS